MTAYGLPLGEISIRPSIVTPGGVFFAPKKKVNVLNLPIAKGRITARSPATPGERITFDGASSLDSLGKTTGITKWLWNFGDQTAPVTGKAPSHRYAGAGKYMLTLEVTDSSGLKGYAYYEVKVGGPPPVVPAGGQRLGVWKDCACQSMTIRRSANKTFTPGYTTTAGGFTGMVNEVGTPGVMRPKIYYGFEVVARILGNPDQCYEWQAIQRSSLGGDFSGTSLKHLPTRVALKRQVKLPESLSKRTGVFPYQNLPVGSATRRARHANDFGLDGYTRPDSVKVHEPGVVRWRDRPGLSSNGLSGPNMRNIFPNGYFYNADFITVVGGTRGSSHPSRECRCRFQVNIDVDPAGRTRKGWLTRVFDADERKCVYTP